MGCSDWQETIYFIKVGEGMDALKQLVASSASKHLNLTMTEASSSVNFYCQVGMLNVIYEGVRPIAAIAYTVDDENKVVIVQFFVPIAGKVTPVIDKVCKFLMQEHKGYRLGFWLPIKFFWSIRENSKILKPTVFFAVAQHESLGYNIVSEFSEDFVDSKLGANGSDEVHEFETSDDIDSWLEVSDEEWLKEGEVQDD